MSLILEDVINAIPGNGGATDGYTKQEADAKFFAKSGGTISGAVTIEGPLDVANQLDVYNEEGGSFQVGFAAGATYLATNNGLDVLAQTDFLTSPTTSDITSFEEASIKALVNKKQVSEAIADTTKVAELTAEVTLADKTIFRGAEMASITVTLPDNFSDTFLCEIDFSSGEEATAFTIADTVKWTGDDIADGAFVPMTNTRYQAMIFYDGLAFNGVVRGVAL